MEEGLPGLNLRLFIIMRYIKYTISIYDARNTLGRPNEERGVLDPDIDEGQLESHAQN